MSWMQVADNAFKVDAKVDKLLGHVEKTLQLVSSRNIYGKDNAAPDQRNGAICIMHQISECLSFVNTYSRESYCMSVRPDL